jgi:hypothetical protein
MSVARLEADAIGDRLGYRAYHAEARYDLRLSPAVAARAAVVKQARGDRTAVRAIPEEALDAAAPLNTPEGKRAPVGRESIWRWQNARRGESRARKREATLELAEAEFRRALAAVALMRLETGNRRGPMTLSVVAARLGLGLSCFKKRRDRWQQEWREQLRAAMAEKPEPNHPIPTEEADDDGCDS